MSVSYRVHEFLSKLNTGHFAIIQSLFWNTRKIFHDNFVMLLISNNLATLCESSMFTEILAGNLKND